MIRTVLGDIESALLGVTDYHEHAFQRSPLLAGDELDDEARSSTELGELGASGFAAMIDATPVGLGRRPQALARLSRQTRLTIVATTGAHRDAHYPDHHWLLQEDESALAKLFTREITETMQSEEPDAPAPVRAGLLKAGVDYWHISPFERRVLGAVASAHRATNAPIMVHLETGSAAFEVLEILNAAGVESDAVVLAHIDRNPDPFLHADLAATGAYLGYDGFARTKDWPDSVLIDALLRTSEAGAAERILIGGDVARRSRYRAYGGMPGLKYLGERVLPRLAAISPQLLERVSVSNPARFLNRFDLKS